MASTEKPAEDIRDHFLKLQKRCEEILTESFAGESAQLMASSRELHFEIDAWVDALETRKETQLLRTASLEYEFALLSLAQGQYRQAFKSLRLVLELSLQAVHLSANELALRAWLANQADTIWAAIVDEEKGIYSPQFVSIFFPDLKDDVPHYLGIAGSLYRECSECVHGNVPKHITLPTSLTFSKSIFDLWHEKAGFVARCIHFTLCLRYLCDLTPQQIAKLEPTLSERVGHISAIRQCLGGPTEPKI
jgi:hypothetical protein